MSLPVWIPGSYLVREFAKNLQSLRARQGGRAVRAAATRQVQLADRLRARQARWCCSYEVYAYDNSVRTAWLDDAARLLQRHQPVPAGATARTDAPHALELVAPQRHGRALVRAPPALAPRKVDKQGFGTYLAADYDELVDCPVEMGAFWSAEFEAGGVPHRFVVAGATASLRRRPAAGRHAQASARRRCASGTATRSASAAAKPPHERYVFMLNAVDDGYGGLEHRNSHRADLPRGATCRGSGERTQSEGYITLLGLISHEYFHTWNVKRLRPAEFARYDYAGENYTQLLWFFEGFTSYYDDLLLRRAGLIDDATYLQAAEQDHQPGAADAGPARCSRWRRPASTPGSSTTGRTRTRQRHGQLLHQGRAGRAVLRPHAARRGPRHAGRRDARAVAALQGGARWPRPTSPPCCKRAGRPRLHAARSPRWVHGTRRTAAGRNCCEPHGVAVLDEPGAAAAAAGPARDREPTAACRSRWCCAAARPSRPALRPTTNGWASRVGAAAGWRMTKLDDLLLYAGTTRK